MRKGIARALACALAVAAPLAGWATQGLAADGSLMFTVVDAHQIHVYVRLYSGYGASADGSGNAYEICWAKTNAPPCTAHHQASREAKFLISGLQSGETFHFKVRCHCKRLAPFEAWIWQDVAAQDFTFLPPIRLPSVGATYRVRAIASNQCLYIDQNGALAKSAACGTDPNMRFTLLFSNHEGYQLRNVHSGLCLWGASSNTPDLGAANCGAIGTTIILEILAGNKVRIAIPRTGTSALNAGEGGCVRVDGGDGAPAVKAPCGSDARMEFIFDPA